MKLGFVSAILPELSLEQVLAFERDEDLAGQRSVLAGRSDGGWNQIQAGSKST